MLTLSLATSPSATSPSPTLKLTLVAVDIAEEKLVVGSLASAVKAVRDFILAHGMTATDYGDVCGRIERDGVPYCRVSFYGRLWALDEQGREMFREMSLSGVVAP